LVLRGVSGAARNVGAQLCGEARQPRERGIDAREAARRGADDAIEAAMLAAAPALVGERAEQRG